mmetsp:Transcript_20146/g.35775  ORF Transcript_20146/g.35775 Transcript_20146/m.35775 type:complete len:208 (-) Transcript_20146:5375-5998(-)
MQLLPIPSQELPVFCRLVDETWALELVCALFRLLVLVVFDPLEAHQRERATNLSAVEAFITISSTRSMRCRNLCTMIGEGHGCLPWSISYEFRGLRTALSETKTQLLIPVLVQTQRLIDESEQLLLSRGLEQASSPEQILETLVIHLQHVRARCFFGCTLDLRILGVCRQCHWNSRCGQLRSIEGRSKHDVAVEHAGERSIKDLDLI